MNSIKPCISLPDKTKAAQNIHHGWCPYWRRADTALKLLGEKFPSFDQESSLLKSVAINALYGTQVFAIAKMADHVSKIVCQHQRYKDKPAILVDAIATANINGKTRHFVSFASKFCHFFIDDERFPIYDHAACTTLSLHLEKRLIVDGEKPYTAFCNNIKFLLKLSNISCSLSTLDRYLWIRGLYVEFEKHGVEAKINGEIKQYFSRARAENDTNLAMLTN